MDGTVITNKGIALIAKLVASKQKLDLCRTAVGVGVLQSGYDPGSLNNLVNYKMDGIISELETTGNNTAVISLQINSIGITEGFVITEAGVFANDPDLGEILYAYIDLSNDTQYIYPEGGDSVKLFELSLEIVIGNIQKVTTYINGSSLVTTDRFEKSKKDLEDLIRDLDNKKMIVVIEQDIPVSERKANTFYFKITDKQAASTANSIKVSPNMGLKIL